MTKVRYSLAASLNCKFVIVLVQRRSLLEGCSLNMCAQNRLPLLKHRSVAVTNLFGDNFLTCHRQLIHTSAQVHLEVALPPHGSHV